MVSNRFLNRYCRFQISDLSKGVHVWTPSPVEGKTIAGLRDRPLVRISMLRSRKRGGHGAPPLQVNYEPLAFVRHRLIIEVGNH